MKNFKENEFEFEPFTLWEFAKPSWEFLEQSSYSHMSCCGRLETQTFELIFKSCFQKADITISDHVEPLKYHFTTNLNCFKQT